MDVLSWMAISIDQARRSTETGIGRAVIMKGMCLAYARYVPRYSSDVAGDSVTANGIGRGRRPSCHARVAGRALAALWAGAPLSRARTF